MTVGERIKFLREQNNMTQADVAKQIGIATQSIFKYEKNIVTNIPSDNIEKMAKVFGVSPSYIMGWEDAMERTPPTSAEIEAPNDLSKHTPEIEDFLKMISGFSKEQIETLRPYAEFIKGMEEKGEKD